jgi:hypothetical protein
VLILGVGGWLGTREGPRPVPTASPDAAASDPSSIDGNGPSVIDPPIIPALDPTVGEARFSFADPTQGWEEQEFSITKSIVGPQGAEAIIFWTSLPGDDRVSPCTSLLGDAMGASGADLATEMASAPGTRLVGEPSDVTVGMRPAKHVELVVREDAGCDPGYFFEWPHDECWGACWLEMEAGYRINVWIVEAADTLIVFEAATSTQADPELQEEIRQVVRSIRFEGSAYILDLDTRAATFLPDAISVSLGERPPDPGGRYAAAPGGAALAYVAADDDGRFQVFVADLDGTGIRQVTSDPVGASTPAWSPDGTRIAYGGHTGPGAAGLFILDIATGEATKVIDVATEWPQPTFTPDGSSLLYSSAGDVLTVPIAGGRSTVLFGHGRGGMGFAGVASMSPDGSLVTMMGNEPNGPGALRFVANTDGTDLRVIGGGAGGSNPAGTWSPDGTRIACTRWDGEHIIVVDVATRDVAEVAEGSSAIWLDDHTLLLEA